MGAEGVTVGQYGLWSRANDRFVGVRFPNVGTFDILWESLEIIDQEYLKEVADREKERLELLKNARNVVRFVGARGGFRYLSYEYTAEDGIACHTSTGARQEAEKLMKFFKEQGIDVACHEQEHPDDKNLTIPRATGVDRRRRPSQAHAVKRPLIPLAALLGACCGRYRLQSAQHTSAVSEPMQQREPASPSSVGSIISHRSVSVPGSAAIRSFPFS